jgi:hypothetical protein
LNLEAVVVSCIHRLLDQSGSRPEGVPLDEGGSRLVDDSRTNVPNTTDTAPLGEDERQQYLLLKRRVEADLAVPLRCNEAQRQFLFYARKIVCHELAKRPAPCRTMNVWLKTFLDAASYENLQDFPHDTLPPPTPVQVHGPIHEPLFMTMSCSLMQRGSGSLGDARTDNDGPDGLCRPYSALYDTFCRGQWTPQERSATDLKRTVLKIRRDWALQVQLPGQWARTVRSTIEVIHSGVIRRAFTNLRSNNQIRFIEGVARRAIGRMVADALAWNKSSKMVLPLPQDTKGWLYPPPRQMWLKVCPTDKDLPIITVATPSGTGSFKVIWKVVRLIGDVSSDHIPSSTYAYVEFKALTAQRQSEHLLKSLLLAARSSHNVVQEQQLQLKTTVTAGTRASIQEIIEREVAITNGVGADIAVPMKIQRKQSNPVIIKGAEMEFWDTDLTRFLCRPLPLQNRIPIALAACFLIARLHQHMILHLDVKCGNFLCRAQGTRLTIRLADFGAARRNCYGQPYRRHVCTFRPPEAFGKAGPQPVFGPQIDAWGLGITIFEIVYGTRARQRIVNKQDVTETQRTLMQVLQEAPCGQPDVDAAICGLLDFSPDTRWSAQKAMERLRRTI